MPIDTTPTAEAVRYLRQLAAHDPDLDAAGTISVVNIDTLPDAPYTMVMDLSDGTTIRLDVERYDNLGGLLSW